MKTVLTVAATEHPHCMVAMKVCSYWTMECRKYCVDLKCSAWIFVHGFRWQESGFQHRIICGTFILLNNYLILLYVLRSNTLHRYSFDISLFIFRFCSSTEKNHMIQSIRCMLFFSIARSILFQLSLIFGVIRFCITVAYSRGFFSVDLSNYIRNIIVAISCNMRQLCFNEVL